ncbi:MAG: ABC transporter ATP-binding protein [Lachnospiraceae bacterium]|nr:ABC transporter ATP-binding protein [Lachnospiraceae bacterium]
MYNIEIENLTKRYKNGVAALDHVSLMVGSGVYGLLGHNGAGKTTLMKALVTVLEPSGGSIRVCGFDTKKQGNDVRKLIGYLPQELAMYPSLTAFDFVSYMAELKGIYHKNAVYAALEQVEMLEFAKRKIGQLSGGMKRRIGIAQALVGSPQVLVVDEPTAGLDPEERVRFRGVLSRFAKDGKTVILSTHIVEDVYQACEELAVLRKGGLLYTGTSAGLMKQVEGKIKSIKLEHEEDLVDLQKQAVVISTTYESAGLTARIMDENMIFTEAKPVPATLEDAYVYFMGGKAHA